MTRFSASQIAHALATSVPRRRMRDESTLSWTSYRDAWLSEWFKLDTHVSRWKAATRQHKSMREQAAEQVADMPIILFKGSAADAAAAAAVCHLPSNLCLYKRVPSLRTLEVGPMVFDAERAQLTLRGHFAEDGGELTTTREAAVHYEFAPSNGESPLLAKRRRDRHREREIQALEDMASTRILDAKEVVQEADEDGVVDDEPPVNVVLSAAAAVHGAEEHEWISFNTSGLNAGGKRLVYRDMHTNRTYLVPPRRAHGIAEAIHKLSWEPILTIPEPAPVRPRGTRTQKRQQPENVSTGSRSPCVNLPLEEEEDEEAICCRVAAECARKDWYAPSALPEVISNKAQRQQEPTEFSASGERPPHYLV